MSSNRLFSRKHFLTAVTEWSSSRQTRTIWTTQVISKQWIKLKKLNEKIPSGEPHHVILLSQVKSLTLQPWAWKNSSTQRSKLFHCPLQPWMLNHDENENSNQQLPKLSFKINSGDQRNIARKSQMGIWRIDIMGKWQSRTNLDKNKHRWSDNGRIPYPKGL